METAVKAVFSFFLIYSNLTTQLTSRYVIVEVSLLKGVLFIKTAKKWLFRLVLVAVLIYTFSYWKTPALNGLHFAKDTVVDLFTSNQPNENHPLTSNNTEKVTITTPESQTFSIANIELGHTKQAIEKQYGASQAEYQNEYGFSWSVYHQNYQNFFLVGYDADNQVQGLYTNQDLLSSTNGITFNETKATVREILGEPLEAIRKGLTNYLITSDGEYDVYHIDNSYITFFYDLHEGEKITAVQIIAEKTELAKDNLYASSSSALQEGFERLLFDLTNATRAKRGLSILSWSEQAQVTGRKHSEDMSVNNYFDHTNLEGQSPFDRMSADNITYTLAGENLAYGQPSSIFAHQGLLNSEGHRKNILQPDFANLGIGVSFNNEDQPYFTELFYHE